MGFEYKTIRELDKSFKKLNDGLKDKHDVSKNKSLNQDRKVQIHFLQKILELVMSSKCDAKEQAKIFTGALLLVQKAIAATYGLRDPNNSYLHEQIPQCIGAKSDNVVSDTDLFEMLNKLLPLLAQDLFVDPLHHESINENTLFQTHDIAKVMSLFQKGTSIQKELSDQLSNQALKAYLDKVNGKSSSFFTGLFGTSQGKGKGKESAEETAEASSSNAP